MYSLFVNNNTSTNNGSTVTLNMNPPIHLNPEKKYYASVYEADIVFCFPNIVTGKNDKFIFKEVVGGVLTTFTEYFDQGIYSIASIQNEINRITQETVQNPSLFVLDADESSAHIYVHFKTTTAQIVCSGLNDVMSIIGYPNTTGILGPVTHVNDFYEGNKATLDSVQNVYVLASFVNGGYINQQSDCILCSVTPDVVPFSTILYRVKIPMKVPVCQTLLDTITIRLVDQDMKPIIMGIINPTDKPERWAMRIGITSE